MVLIHRQVAYHAGDERARQVWLLMGSSLSDYVPTLSPTRPQISSVAKVDPQGSALSQSVSAPPGVANNYTFPAHNLRGTDSAPSVMKRTSPGRASMTSVDHKPSQRSSSSTSRKLTPTSSTSSSPRYVSSPLPPITPRRPSFFTGRRESVDSGLVKHPALYRRPSLSAPSTHSASPSDRSNASLRHVGEGALDDSDSSSGSGSGGDGAKYGASSDEETSLLPLTSPILGPLRGIVAPSPLSRVAGQQQWTEDEDADADAEGKDDEEENSSPSPRSTDTESSGSNSPRQRSKSTMSSRRNSTRFKSRSRSSTVASLAAPVVRHRSLTHQESHSSIRTVTAEVSFRDNESGTGLKAEDTIRDLRSTHNRSKSQAVSDCNLDVEAVDDQARESLPDTGKMTERRVELVRFEENNLREIGWAALRDALELFADEVR